MIINGVSFSEDNMRDVLDIVIRHYPKDEPWGKVMIAFWERMKAKAASAQFIVHIWGAGLHASDHIFEFSGSMEFLLYAKVSMLRKPQWSLNCRQMDLLRKKRGKWAIVLLDKSEDHGWFLKCTNFFAIESDLSPGKTAYTVYETKLGHARRFSSFFDLVDLLEGSVV